MSRRERDPVPYVLGAFALLLTIACFFGVRQSAEKRARCEAAGGIIVGRDHTCIRASALIRVPQS